MSTQDSNPPSRPSSPHQTSHVENPSHKQLLADFLSSEYGTIATSLLADVSIYCKNTEFKAHRIVLCHYSTFFRDIFNSVPGSKHFDVFLEGFDEQEIESVLTFCYTGNLLWEDASGSGCGRGKLVDVSNALQIQSLSALLESSQEPSIPHADNNNKERSPGNDSSSSPVSIWQKCGMLDDEIEYASEDEEAYYFDHKRKNHDNSGVSKRRKQAQPKRHKPTPPHSRSQSPEDLPSCSDDDEDYTPPDSYEDDDLHSRSPPLLPEQTIPENLSPMSTPPQVPNPLPTPPQNPHPLVNIQDGVQPPAPPPHFLFLRNMMNQSGAAQHHGPPPPPPHHFFHPHVGKKMGVGNQKGGLWGKLMGKGGPGGGVSGVYHHHGTSRAQHSAPRGGPPRAWSNQDLTEALHNVWNKKMTTSQASRIFGIPYNSLLMYVRGKYGKSLKLDLLKKGLDLALLEKQQKMKTTTEQRSGQQNGQNGGSTGSSSSSSHAAAGSPRNNVVEWMMMNSSGSAVAGGNKILERPPLFHPALFFQDRAGGGSNGGIPNEFPRNLDK